MPGQYYNLTIWRSEPSSYRRHFIRMIITLHHFAYCEQNHNYQICSNVFVGPEMSLYVCPYEYVWKVLRKFDATAQQFPNFLPKYENRKIHSRLLVVQTFIFFHPSRSSTFLLKSVIRYLWHGRLHQELSVTSSRFAIQFRYLHFWIFQCIF